GGVEKNLLVWHVVGRADGGGTGVVVVIFPGGERAVLADAAGNLDDSRRPQVGPHEFLVARPDELDRFARGLGEPGGFDGTAAGVLAAVAGAGVGNDHAHAVLGEAEGVH